MLKFQVATSGLSAPIDTTIGEIWVSYEIELLKPVVPRLLGPGPGPTPGPGTLDYSVFRKNGSDVSAIGQLGTFGHFAGNAGTAPNIQVTNTGPGSGTTLQVNLSALPIGPFTFTMSRYNPASALSDITSANWVTGGAAGVVYLEVADVGNYKSLLLSGVVNSTTNELAIVFTAAAGQTASSVGYDMSITTANSATA
jgi:hypothetical protein